MTDLIATTPGLYPLPDWAKDELSELKGHQKGDLISGDEGPEIVDAYQRARNDVVDAQTDAGLDRVVEGQLRWDDMLAHPLTVHDNVETGGIVRYYDNNNFYRDPQVQDELTASGDVAAELESVDAGPQQAVLPGPYSLSDLATDEHYGDEAEFLDAIADYLAGEIDAFPSHETLFLLEPSLVENAPDDDTQELASEAIDRVADATDADVVVHTYWGAIPEKTYAYLMDADVDAIGFDFVTDADESLYNINEYGTKNQIAMGVVDGQNTLVESPETIRDRADWVLENAHEEFDQAYLTANTELFYLPVNKFEDKLQALGDAATLAEVDA
ncbi:5-methyltetrahydropteroyltriglutamate--homocysteine methyltransferase [Haloplanus vescus]|uniref:5-methyltetrahydropteroyltriglutamate--homocysteine methyltransferase n=1 Tax=Haloplanus vescus TaxID=555874 RepID=A0A1H3WFV3_9EURY|nr:5-methyltetrahydropteroyltriglutamate--homocysteine methyltransferase [Haloplanus vescus]SDZ85118.1 5-methyltetrahydropteroyltriglutamate--homocysteine methyltransferase [Haloplanus vescus]